MAEDAPAAKKPRTEAAECDGETGNHRGKIAIVTGITGQVKRGRDAESAAHSSPAVVVSCGSCVVLGREGMEEGETR